MIIHITIAVDVNHTVLHLNFQPHLFPDIHPIFRTDCIHLIHLLGSTYVNLVFVVTLHINLVKRTTNLAHM
jgi:hypothetical protein